MDISKINQDRDAKYGTFMHNSIVAQGLKEVLRNAPINPNRKAHGWHRLPADVQEALDLITLKISRILTGDPEYLDNWDDIQGYARCVSERIRYEQQQHKHNSASGGVGGGGTSGAVTTAGGLLTR
jgi:hypothetical protein